ncbi:DUF5994 family protein [Haloactinopolyspora alba]|nr:DUF5994 family protein [Haloactinopolyspora alba]
MPDDDVTARIAYRVVRPGDHPRLHGVWWPRSHELTAELPSLINSLDSRGFTTEWISFSHKGWDTVSQQMIVAGRPVRLALFQSIDPNMVRLSGNDGSARIDLLVVPPTCRTTLAAEAFARVLNWDNRASASSALAAATTTHGAGVPAVKVPRARGGKNRTQLTPS